MSNEYKCSPESDAQATAIREVMNRAYDNDKNVTLAHRTEMKDNKPIITIDGKDLFISVNEMMIRAYDSAKKHVDAMPIQDVRDILITAMTSKTLIAYEMFIKEVCPNESKPINPVGDSQSGQQNPNPVEQVSGQSPATDVQRA